MTLCLISPAIAQTWRTYYDSAAAILQHTNSARRAAVLLEEAKNRIHPEAADVSETTIVHAALVNVYSKLEDYTQAKLELEELLKKDESLVPLVDLKCVYTIAMREQENGDLNSCKRYLKSIILSPGATASIVSNSARRLIGIYIAGQRPDSAMIVWNTLVSRESTIPRHNPRWRQLHAQILLENRLYHEASLELDSLIAGFNATASRRNTSLFAEVMSLRSRLDNLTGNYNEALTTTRRAIKAVAQDSISPDVYHDLIYSQAEAYQNMNRHRKALKRLIKLGPMVAEAKGRDSFDYTNVQKRVAGTYISMRNYPGAIKIYEEILQLYQKSIPESDSRFIGLLNDMGTCMLDYGKPHPAYIYLRWAHEMTARNGDPALTGEINRSLAKVYAMKGDEVQAALHLKEASATASNE